MRTTTSAVFALALLGAGSFALPAPVTPALAASGTVTGASAGEAAWRAAEDPVTDLLSARERDGFSALSDGTGPQIRRIEKLLDQAVAILSDGQADGGAERTRLRELQARISGLRKKIADARFSMASAPEAAPGLAGQVLAQIGLGPASKDTWRARIADHEADIKSIEEQQNALKATFAARLGALGVNLTPQQVEGLMAMATAEDFLAMQSAFENMKAINQVLLDATVRADESLEVAKRYYGIYTVMLEIALYMHDEFVQKVEGEYLGKLSAIEAKTREERERTKELLGRERDAGLRSTLERNLKAQDLTLRTAKIYRERLSEQRDRIKQSAALIARQHAVAVNTWRTVDQSAALVTMMRSTGKTFESLMNLEIPPLRPFESIEMQNELEKLTNELKPMS